MVEKGLLENGTDAIDELSYRGLEGSQNVAVALTHAGRYEWSEFNSVFIEHITRAEQSGDTSTYYQSWLAALGELALKKGFIDEDEMAERPRHLSEEDAHS